MIHILDWLMILTCAAIVAMVLNGLAHSRPATLADQAERLAQQDARREEKDE